MPGAAHAYPINGVNCWIDAEGGVVESWGSEGFKATVYFRCAWSDRFTLALGLRGGYTASGSTLVPIPAFRYPDNPGLACVALGEFQPQKLRRDERNWASYQYVVIPAVFQVPNWAEGIQFPNVPVFTKVSFNTAPEVFSPPGGAFYIPDLSGMPAPESTIGFIRPHVEITMTRSYLPYPPVEADLFFQGTLNKNPIQFGDRMFPKGTLMYCGMSAEPQSDPSVGTQTYECAFKFLGNYEVDFNEFLGTDGKWHLLNDKSDGSGDPPFEYEDFAWFFGYDLAAPTEAADRENFVD